MEFIAVSEFMSGIAKKQERLLEDLGIFQDWTERYEYVIGLGKKLEPLDDEARNGEHLIKGCQSQVWLDAKAKDGKVYFFCRLRFADHQRDDRFVYQRPERGDAGRYFDGGHEFH
jgi:hypothetical protein